MRTTLNIDEDVLTTARFLARQNELTVGQVISDLARHALRGSDLDASTRSSAARGASTPLERKLERLGLTPFKASGGSVVTEDLVRAIRDSEGV